MSEPFDWAAVQTEAKYSTVTLVFSVGWLLQLQHGGVPNQWTAIIWHKMFAVAICPVLVASNCNLFVQ